MPHLHFDVFVAEDGDFVTPTPEHNRKRAKTIIVPVPVSSKTEDVTFLRYIWKTFRRYALAIPCTEELNGFDMNVALNHKTVELMVQHLERTGQAPWRNTTSPDVCHT